MKKLTQDVFVNQPNEVNWAGVDYDGKLNYGIAINPRVNYNSGIYHSYEKIGKPIPSNFIPETSIYRIMPNYEKYICFLNNFQFKKGEFYFLYKTFDNYNFYSFIDVTGKFVGNVSALIFQDCFKYVENEA